MAFDFQAYRNPYVSTIAELLSRGEDAKAKALIDVANAQAQAAQVRGQAWGGAIEGIGQTAAKAITDYNDPKARQQRELDRGQAILKARGQEQQLNDRQRVMLGEVVPARTDVEYRQRPVDDGMSRPFGNIQFGASRGPNVSTSETFALGVPSPDGSTIENPSSMSPVGNATVQRGLARADAFGLNPQPDTQDGRMSQLLQGSLGTSEVRQVPASRTPSRVETVTGPSVGRYTTPEGLYDVPKAYDDLIRAGISQQVATALAGQGQQANSIFDAFDKQKQAYGKSQVAVHGAIANMALQLADAQPGLSLEEALQSVIGPAGKRVDPKDIDALGVAMFGKSEAEKRQMLESLVKQWDAQGPRQVVNPGDSSIGASGRIQQIGQRPVTAADQLLMQNRNDYAEAVKSGYTGPYAKWLAEQSRAPDKLTPAEMELDAFAKERGKQGRSSLTDVDFKAYAIRKNLANNDPQMAVLRDLTIAAARDKAETTQAARSAKSDFEKLPANIQGAAASIGLRMSSDIARANLNTQLAKAPDEAAQLRILRVAAIPIGAAGVAHVNRQAAIDALNEIQSSLTELRNAGAVVPEGPVAGRLEQIANLFGTSRNVEYKRLGARIGTALINYRRGITGAAFSAKEAEEYKNLFGQFTDTSKLTDAVLSGFKNSLESDLISNYTTFLGGDEMTARLLASRPTFKSTTVKPGADLGADFAYQ